MTVIPLPPEYVEVNHLVKKLADEAGVITKSSGYKTMNVARMSKPGSRALRRKVAVSKKVRRWYAPVWMVLIIEETIGRGCKEFFIGKRKKLYRELVDKVQKASQSHSETVTITATYILSGREELRDACRYYLRGQSL